MNSLPMPRARSSAPAKSAAAAATVKARCASAALSAGRYSRCSPRINGLSSSLCTLPPRSRLQSTGTSVTATTVAASTANVLVKASGWNSLPSWPVSANTGRKDSRMITTEKKIGRPDEPGRFQDGLPHETAIPRIDGALFQEAERVLGDDDAGVDEDADGDGDPRQAHDVRRDAGAVHPEEEMSTASGSVIVTIRIDRRCIRKSTCASVTRTISSTSARRSVSDGLLDQGRAVVERHDP